MERARRGRLSDKIALPGNKITLPKYLVYLLQLIVIWTVGWNPSHPHQDISAHPSAKLAGSYTVQVQLQHAPEQKVSASASRLSHDI